MDLLQQLVDQQLSGANLSHIANRIGADPGATRAGIAAAVPTLLAALSRNASEPGGAEALHGALARDHDGGLLDDLMGLMGGASGGRAADGAGILGHVLGNRRSGVEAGLARGTGLDPAAMGALLTVVAPMVMGALGKAQRQQGLDAGGLAGLLSGQQRSAQSSAPELMGMLGTLLDSDHDGNVMDDLGGLASRLFGGR